MFPQRILLCCLIAFGFAFECPQLCHAQMQVLSPAPPNVEYQYQMYYPRWYGWPGPGLSLGGTLPTRGREGYSSFYGRPLPVPLGSGVFVNPYAYATQLPGFFSYGLAQSGSSPNGNPGQSSQPIVQAGQAGSIPLMPPSPPAEKTSEATDSARLRSASSSETTLRQSREVESFGDDNLRRHQWTQAYVNYRNAVEIASDNADAHFRLGVASIALTKYSEAVREFKQALSIDPTLATSQKSLAAILGPDSKAVRTELTHNVARWTKEDLKDQDRLFLLGAILRYNEDPRSQEILEAAFRMTGSGEHLIALLVPRNPTRGIELTAQLPACEVPGEPVPFSELTRSMSPQQVIEAQMKLNGKLPPAPSPEPPDQPKAPELHRQPVDLPSPR